ncbi:MAG: hypothetical protein CMQ41_08295 [Gammaproteobacteria bacterium]|nr:hypothetical protein [Gammaproteobacteria bacterium]
MLINFFMTLKQERLPVSFTELFTLLECLKENVIFGNVDEFYYLSRLCLVKDEKNFDKFDIAFAKYFENIEAFEDLSLYEIPEEWLRKNLESMLTDEEKAKIEALGGLEKLMEEFKKRMEEQQKRHQGGNKWIGTGGTSPFGAYGYNPEGIRIGQDGSRNQRAAKVWDRRNYRDLDDSIEIGTRNIKLALRRLRKFARTGAAEELDLDNTISCTAKNAGFLDIKMVPERRNAVKVLLFFDVGGSMDPHVRLCEELFSAAKSEFKHLQYYYFHNFIYESVWTKSRRRHAETTSTFEIINKYSKDYKIIFVGDATMAPYEITHIGGSIEHYNEEAGVVWIKRIVDAFSHMVWLNPTPKDYWDHSYSIEITREVVEGRMFPLTVKGLEDAMSLLTK